MSNSEKKLINKEIIDAAEKKALEIARRDGLRIGSIVGLEGDAYSYELKKIEGNMAVIGYENDRHGKVEKTVPLNLLLDVHTAQKIAVEMRAKALLAMNPKNLN